MKDQVMEMATNGFLGLMGGMTRYLFQLMSGEKKFSLLYMTGMMFVSITIAVSVGDIIPDDWFDHGRNGVMVFVGIVSFEVMKEIIERLPKKIADQIAKK